MKIALIVLAAFWIGSTLIPLVRSPQWWIRVFDFPRLQIAIGLVVTLALLAAATDAFRGAAPWEVALGVALAGCTVYQAWRIAPYTPIARSESMRASESPEDRTFRLVVSNVLMSNREGDRWLAVIRRADPDLIVTLESDRWWQDEVLRELASDYPYAVDVPQDDTYGMHLRSRLPLEGRRVRYRVEDFVPSIEATIVVGDRRRVDAFFLHPMPPRPEFDQDTDRRDAELVFVAREVADRQLNDPSRPILVAGDLNDVAWSDTTRLFQNLSGLLDPRKGRGLFSTFHAKYPVLRWPLDHVFHSADLCLVGIERLADVGSDHFPMCVTFAIDEGVSGADEPSGDADEEAEADEVVEEAEERAAERDPEDEPDPDER